MWWELTNRLVLSFAILLWKVEVLCVWTRTIYDYRNEKGLKAYRSIIAIMNFMITIILPVYCNIIDALVQVTSLIFLQTNFDEMIYKTVSRVMIFSKSMKTTATMIKIVFWWK